MFRLSYEMSRHLDSTELVSPLTFFEDTRFN